MTNFEYVPYIIYILSTVVICSLFERNRLSQRVDRILVEINTIKDDFYFHKNIV
jgi:hypothetical protein